MQNSFRRFAPAGTWSLVPALILCLLSLSAHPANGQSTTPPTPFMKQVNRIDFSVVAAGEISSAVSGIEQRDANVVSTTMSGGTTTSSVSSTNLYIKPSTTVGELVTLRYIAKPYVGFEFNFGNLRYTQNYTFTETTKTTTTTGTSSSSTTTTSYPNYLNGGVQNGARELTLGYVAHLPWHPFGIAPYAGAGGGTVRFTPTPGGGQGLPFQYRAAYYYNLGVEDNFPGSNFGMRLGFRQLIYLAPDFQQNYLTITRRTRTSEPIIGFFVRF